MHAVVEERSSRPVLSMPCSYGTKISYMLSSTVMCSKLVRHPFLAELCFVLIFHCPTHIR